MTMKKVDRKKAYVKIINLMIAGDNKGAFDAVKDLCADDSSLFVFNDYEEARKAFEEKKEK